MLHAILRSAAAIAVAIPIRSMAIDTVCPICLVAIGLLTDGDSASSVTTDIVTMSISRFGVDTGGDIEARVAL